MTDVWKELLPTEADLHLARLGDYPGAAGTKRIAAAYDALTRAQPAPADVVEAVARAIREAQYPNGTSWDDWEEYHAANPGRFDGRDESRRLAKAALAAIPVSGEAERLREENEGLKHDLDRYMKIANIECNEAERLGKALRDLLTAVESADSTKRGDFYHERKAARQALTPPRSIRVSDLTDEEVEAIRKPSA
jgi:hypothetical protein